MAKKRKAKQTLKIKFKSGNRRFNKAFETWLFSFGFVWADNKMAVRRDLGENDYYMEIDLNAGTMVFHSFFLDVNDYIEIPIVMEVESEQHEHPVYLQLKKLFNEFRKPLRKQTLSKEKREKKVKIKPKYKVWVKQKNQPITHLRDIKRTVGDI